LFKNAREKQPIKEENYLKNLFLKSEIEFYLDKEKTKLICYSYEELIAQTKEKFIGVLKQFNVYDELMEQHKNEPKKFTKYIDIYIKLLDKKLKEPNLWNLFDDYCYMAIDKYSDKITHIKEFSVYQTNFIEEFMRDIMLFWGSSAKNYVPKEMCAILTKRNRKKRTKKIKN